MMYHAKKWVMDKCIRLGLGQADLLARKHKDNYWVEKRLMDKNASDGVGVTSDRELIRNTIDKILPTVNSFEQLIEYLRAIYHWTITKVRNIRSYMLTTLYNAPVKCSNYYKAEVNHDFYGK